MARTPRYQLLALTLVVLCVALLGVIAWGVLSPGRSLSAEDWLEQPWLAQARATDGGGYRFDVVLSGAGGDAAVEMGNVRLVVQGASCRGRNQTRVELPAPGRSAASLGNAGCRLDFTVESTWVQAEVAGIPFSVHDGWLYVDGESAQVTGPQRSQLLLDAHTGALLQRRETPLTP